MSGPALAILLTVVVHAIGGALLVWALAGRDTFKIFSATRPDDDGGLPPPPRRPSRPTGPRDGVPLPDAKPARRRLRGPGRLGAGRRSRRPEHAPERTPRPAPLRDR